MKPVYLLLGIVSTMACGTSHVQAQAEASVAEAAQRERDATAAALVRLMSEAIEPKRSDEFNQTAFESKYARWSVVYRPSSRDGFLLDAIKVQRDEEVEAVQQQWILPNESMNDLTDSPKTVGVRPSFLLSVEPYLAPAEYARLQTKNKAIYQQLRELDAQMKDIKRQHKSGRYLPANEAEKSRVDVYEKLEATLTRRFPNFYFRDVSLSWSSGLSYGFPYGYNPGYVLETEEKTGWELEQALVAQTVVKLLTRYETAAK